MCVLRLKLNFNVFLTMPTKLLLNVVAVWRQICGDLNRTQSRLARFPLLATSVCLSVIIGKVR